MRVRKSGVLKSRSCAKHPGGPGASGIMGAAWRFESVGESYVKS